MSGGGQCSQLLLHGAGGQAAVHSFGEEAGKQLLGWEGCLLLFAGEQRLHPRRLPEQGFRAASPVSAAFPLCQGPAAPSHPP